jgi:hypothetical protein
MRFVEVEVGRFAQLSVEKGRSTATADLRKLSHCSHT